MSLQDFSGPGFLNLYSSLWWEFQGNIHAVQIKAERSSRARPL